MREKLEGYFPLLAGVLLAGIVAGTMLGITICIWIQAPPDCECPSRAAPAVSPLFTPEGPGICSYVNVHGYIGYPAPTGTPEPTHVFADNAEIAADVCANVYDRIIYPATLTLDGTVTMIGTLHGPLVGRLSGYYQACPTGDWTYDECMLVPAENVTLIRRECATPTPVCECW